MRPKGLKKDVEEWIKISGPPGFPVAQREKSGDLAIQVLILCQLFNLTYPGSIGRFFGIGVSAVFQNKGLIPESTDPFPAGIGIRISRKTEIQRILVLGQGFHSPCKR